MATGNFDGEIKDAMQSKSRMKPGGVPASGKPRAATRGSPTPPPKSAGKPPPSFPPKQQAAVPPQQPHMPLPQAPQQMPMGMPPMQQPDAVGHAAGIAHAILAHGKGGMM